VRRNPQVAGHWHALVEGFASSSLDFYELVKVGVEKRSIPNLAISHVEWKEGGLGTSKRIYLRVSRGGLNFDVCAAPLGTGFFFSWWLARIPRVLLDLAFLLALGFGTLIVLGVSAREGCGGAVGGAFFLGAGLVGLSALVRFGNTPLEPTVLSMPITGFVYQLIFRPVTYFEEDTALMFRESVHNAVLEAIDQVTSAQGVRALAPEARRISTAPGR
jgi:hypothetical protein